MKTIQKLALLRFVAALAIVMFSYEITSMTFVSDDVQMEVSDIDVDDDTESDNEKEVFEATAKEAINESFETHTLNACYGPLTSVCWDPEALTSPPPEHF